MRRRFDVLANGEPLLTDFDIAATGGSRAAVVKSFTALECGEVLELTFRARTDAPAADTLPTICGLELYELPENP